jgi:hypothetical protein
MAKLPRARPVQPAALPLPVPSIWYRYAPGDPTHGDLLDGPPRARPDKAVRHIFYPRAAAVRRHLYQWSGSLLVGVRDLTADWADPDRAARLHRRALCVERLEKTLRDRIAALDASGVQTDWPEFLQLEQALRDLRDLSAAPWCPLEK